MPIIYINTPPTPKGLRFCVDGRRIARNMRMSKWLVYTLRETSKKVRNA